MYKHLNQVGDHVMIPKEAFLFRPHRQDNPQLPDDFRRYEGGEKFRRLIFEGWAQSTYTPQQIQKLEQFQQFLRQKGVILGRNWDRPWKLKWLLATGYNFDKTLNDIWSFEGYQQRVRELTLTHNVAENLRKGMFYLAGRDSHYRPIVVVDAEKIISAELTEEECLETQIYFFQYILRHCFIPGQVESWIALVDSSHQSLFSLMGSVKAMFIFLGNTYKARLYKCYNCRVTLSIRMVWAIVQKLLDPQTINKIHLFQDLNPEGLFDHTNRSQVEEKFGGTLPNFREGEFWPPRPEVSSDYKVPKEDTKFMTEEQYTCNYENKVLFDTRIKQQLLVKKQSTELKENKQKQALRQMEKVFERQFDQVESDRIEIPFDMYNLTQLKESLSYLDIMKKDNQYRRTQH